jgi:hypothetical protein
MNEAIANNTLDELACNIIHSKTSVSIVREGNID